MSEPGIRTLFHCPFKYYFISLVCHPWENNRGEYPLFAGWNAFTAWASHLPELR
jgi:hypothetical protein